MTFLFEFMGLAVTAIFLENVIFSRALGTSRMLALLKSEKNLFTFGAVLTVMTTLASLPIHYLNRLLENLAVQTRIWMRPFLFVVAVTLLYILVYLGCTHLLPGLFAKIGKLLTFATFNCALLGSVFLTADQNFNLAKTLGFGFGSGVGFTVATFLVFEGKRRLMLSDVPKSFRGFPITLLYLGLVALAMYGLVGHQLPF